MEKEQTNENSWEFHLTDKIAQLSKMTLEMHTEFWLSTLQTWFHGYQTPEEYKATIWGREVDLCISIAPLETPTEKLPIIEEKSAKGKNELLPPEQQAYVDELKKKIKALKKLLPPKVDEALEQRYLDYMNAERIKAIIQDCTKIWSNPELSVEEKISQLIPYKIELYDLVRNVQLPDDLMRADTNISITMATIQFFAQSVEKNAKKNKIKTPKQVRQLVKGNYILLYTITKIIKGHITMYPFIIQSFFSFFFPFPSFLTLQERVFRKRGSRGSIFGL